MRTAIREWIGGALLAALAAGGAATLACGATPSGPVLEVSCGSSSPVASCTLLLTPSDGGVGMSNACQVSISSTGGATTISFSTAGSASAPFPLFVGTVVLAGVPVAGQVYPAAQLAPATLTARTDPNSAFIALAGPGGPAGDVSLAVDSFSAAASGAVLHGSLTALLVGQTAAGVLSLCAVF